MTRATRRSLPSSSEGTAVDRAIDAALTVGQPANPYLISSRRGGPVAGDPKEGPSLTWQGADLPRISPGDYKAVCSGWQGPEWCRAFRRWSLRLEFSLFADNAFLSAFFNMGSDAAAPLVARRSRCYTVWCLANGEAPRKGQQMTLTTLTDPALIYLVRVSDSTKDGKDAAKPDALIYSRVTEILKIERP